MKTTFIVGLVCFLSFLMVGFAAAQPTVYIAPDNGFEINIAAALQKKHVPVTIVTDKALADYVLTSTAVQIHKESGAGKVARCLFAYCAGIQDSGDVSVQLIDAHTNVVAWGYNVAKQRAAKNRQSMAEAIAKHFKKDFLEKRAE
jgi:hypothetical protein